ncbi:MAG: sulfate adenylyltransferase subunit CysD [Acidobacteria bacterium]|nr:sulfate adenylyltransferase subunit CysD [Acidobacteriota bacterium]
MVQTRTHLDILEDESIYIFREVVAEFEKPVLLYSVGKDSSVLLHLARKAFAPGKPPFPLMHIDTGYKFPEMYSFRDRMAAEYGFKLIVASNEEAVKSGTNPYQLGTSACCALLKTKGLLGNLKKHGFDAAFGGARRDEEKSRAKERVYSFRDAHGQWDPQNQRPELWNLYNGRIKDGESIRVFPLSNWTEMDVWHYIEREDIPVVPLYFAQKRAVIPQGDHLIPVENHPYPQYLMGEPRMLNSRFRSLGCIPCTGAIQSNATTIRDIIEEMTAIQTSERANRLIDLSSDDAMEQKKREGYF